VRVVAHAPRIEVEAKQHYDKHDHARREAEHELKLDQSARSDNAEPVYAEQHDPQTDYEVSIDLFNEKELQTGLRNIAIVFQGQDGTRVESIPHDQKTRRRESPHSGSDPVEVTDAVEVINLPSRQWVHYELCDTLDYKDARKLDKCETIEFRGYFPDRRPFVKPLTIDKDWKPKEPR